MGLLFKSHSFLMFFDLWFKKTGNCSMYCRGNLRCKLWISHKYYFRKLFSSASQRWPEAIFFMGPQCMWAFFKIKIVVYFLCLKWNKISKSWIYYIFLKMSDFIYLSYKRSSLCRKTGKCQNEKYCYLDVKDCDYERQNNRVLWK